MSTLGKIKKINVIPMPSGGLNCINIYIYICNPINYLEFLFMANDF